MFSKKRNYLTKGISRIWLHQSQSLYMYTYTYAYVYNIMVNKISLQIKWTGQHNCVAKNGATRSRKSRLWHRNRWNGNSTTDWTADRWIFENSGYQQQNGVYPSKTALTLQAGITFTQCGTRSELATSFVRPNLLCQEWFYCSAWN